MLAILIWMRYTIFVGKENTKMLQYLLPIGFTLILMSPIVYYQIKFRRPLKRIARNR